MKWRYGPLLIVIGLAFLAAWPLLIHWQVWGHNATIDYARLLEVDALIRQGVLYPRWCPDFYYGYGSPLFNFYAPGGVLLAEVFALLGVNILYAVKLSYLAGMVLAAIGMFLFARKLWGPTGGAAAAALYVFAPYFLLDVYVRASLGEVLCFAWIPLVLFFVLRGFDGSRRSWGAAALLTAAVICTHNITALLFFPALALFVLLEGERIGRRTGLLWGLATCVLALGLSALFWLPALAEKQFVVGNDVLTTGDYWFGYHFPRIRELFEPRWGFGTSQPGDSISLQLGIPHWILLLGALWAFLRRTQFRRPSTIWLWTVFAVSILFMLPPSACIWERIPLLHFVQFPWRFLLLATVASSALAGAAFAPLESRRWPWRILALAILVTGVLLAYGRYAQPKFLACDFTTREVRMLERDELAAASGDPELTPVEEFLSVDTMRRIGMRATILDDFLPIWVTIKPKTLPTERYEIAEGEVTVEVGRETPLEQSYRVRSSTGGRIEFFTFWFPGWVGTLDGEQIDLFPQSRTGCLSVAVPPGEHDLTIRFTRTPVRTAGVVISVISLLSAVGLMLPIGSLRRRSANSRP